MSLPLFSEALDDALEAYEKTWQHGRPPSLVKFLDSQIVHWEAGERAILERELACIDMERRWRLYFSQEITEAAGLPALPRADDYIAALPALAPARLELLKAEYCVRQQFGDQPPIETLADRRPKDASAVAAMLRQAAAELTQGVVKVFYRSECKLSCPLLPVMSIGRRDVGEPASPSLHPAGDLPRLLIAEHRENTISRRHARIELAGVRRVKLTNESKHSAVTCDAAQPLKSGEARVIELPASFYVGNRRVQIETPRCKARWPS